MPASPTPARGTWIQRAGQRVTSAFEQTQNLTPARARQVQPQHFIQSSIEDRSQHYEADQVDDEENTEEFADEGTLDDGEGEYEGSDVEGAGEEVPMEIDVPFDTTGLKEIGNLASWTVSTFKPGCGVEALRNEDTNLFWQSDGQQPHHLNIHFSRLVSILSIRLYLDFEADESYTPTRITLLAGTGYHDLLPFSQLEFTQPKGWIDVDLSTVGGGRHGPTAGKELRAFLVQVKVVENHQNGKDTHLRGLRIYARDERAARPGNAVDALLEATFNDTATKAISRTGVVEGGHLTEPDWMGEVELR